MLRCFVDKSADCDADCVSNWWCWLLLVAVGMCARAFMIGDAATLATQTTLAAVVGSWLRVGRTYSMNAGPCCAHGCHKLLFWAELRDSVDCNAFLKRSLGLVGCG